MMIRPGNRPLPTNAAKSAAQTTAASTESKAKTAEASESAEFGALPTRIASVSSAAVAEVQADIGQGEYVEGEVIVKLRSGQLGLFNDFASEYGGKVVETFDIPQSVFKSFDGDLIRMKLPAGITTAEAIAAMGEDDRVAYAESNDYQEFVGDGKSDLPDDLHKNLWGFQNNGQTGGTAGADSNVLGAWEVNKGDGSENGPLIAVIDSGADMDHPDLVANFWTNPGEIPGDGIDNDGNGVIDDVHGYDAGDDDGSPDDRVGHGTHVAGTIGAVGNNGQGVTGVNQSARLLPIKISSNGRITTDGVVRALMYATKMGADITNNSWGSPRRNKAIQDAFEAAPALHVAAAGNNNTDTDRRPYFPMGFEQANMLSVAATDHNDRRAGFSNYGQKNVDVAAPGKDIYSTQNGGGHHHLSGTSMASPFVAGVAALIKAEHPNATPTEIKDRLIFGSDPVAALNGKTVSNGRVNAGTSIEHDTIAPGSPNDFKASMATESGSLLSWTSTGDDKWDGQSAATEVRFSSTPIDADNFAEASALKAARPGETGNLEKLQFNVEPSAEERTYHFAMKVVDNVGNRSEMRTTTVTIPARQPHNGDA